MSILEVSARSLDGFRKAMDFVSPIFDLGVRLWVAYVFFKSGLTKDQSWETTKMLVGIFTHRALYRICLCPGQL